MTRTDFAQVMAYVSAAIGKPLPSEAAEVYYDLLGDLPLDVLRSSAKRVVLEHKWASFPTVAEIRAAAADITRGEVTELSPAMAWAFAWRVVARIDLEQPGSAERGLSGLPPLVVEAITAYGLPSLINGKEPVGVVRGQFLKIFEQLAARERRDALLPATLKREIAARALPQRVAAALACVGVEPQPQESDP